MDTSKRENPALNVYLFLTSKYLYVQQLTCYVQKDNIKLLPPRPHSKELPSPNLYILQPPPTMLELPIRFYPQ